MARWESPDNTARRSGGLPSGQSYVFANWFIVYCQLSDQVTWLFYNSTQDCLEASLIWDQVLNPEIHSIKSEWDIFDQRGRLIRLNEKTGIITSMAFS